MAETMSENGVSARGSHSGRVFRLIFWAVLLLLFAAAVLSYSPADSAVLCGGVVREPVNWIGWAGAWLADTLFLHLGLGVYLLLILVMTGAVRSALREFAPAGAAFSRWQGIGGALLALLGALLLLGLVPEMFATTLPPLGLGHEDSLKSGLSGGVIGQFFAAPRQGELTEGLLRHVIGGMGCAIVGIALFAGGLIWLYIAEWNGLVAEFFRRPARPEVPADPYAAVQGTPVPRDLPFSRVQPQPQSFTVTPVPPPQPAPPPAPAPAPAAAPAPAPAPAPAAPVPAPAPTPAPAPAAELRDMETLPPVPDEPEDDGEPEEDPPAPAPAPAPAPVPPAPQVRSSDLKTQVAHAGTAVTAPPLAEYVLPPVTMLSQGDEACGEDVEEISAAKSALEQTLDDFGIRGWVSNHTTGPRVTRFEITLEPGVNVRKVEQIADNIAMNLSAQSVRILAPIPGRPVVGVEVSNSKASAVFMRSVMESEQWRSGKAGIPVALGKDVSGKPVVLDIASAPHLLIAGSTGTGKSVCSNSLIMSLLFRFRPDELKLIMVDPKVVEFDVYKNLPHLLTPVINDSAKVPVALRWAVNEMEKRYRILAAASVKKISEYNARPIPPEPVLDSDGVPIPDRMPVLIVIIDELGDLMMTEAKKDVENSITRIAQKGRAAGVHVVVATQRPSTNVITGVIKANLPTRLCFQVRSLIDSRVVLDSPGGEKLLGKGDMLYMSPHSMHIERVQGSFVPDSDIQKVVEFVCAQAPQQFNNAVLAEEEEPGAEGKGAAPGDEDEDDDDGGAPWDEGADVSDLVKKYLRPGDDDVMRQALEVVILDRKASTSYLQRRLGIGYNRAAELIDKMQARGIVGPPSGSGNKREILVFDGLDIKE